MKKLSVRSLAVCLMAFLMIGLCIAFTACGDKGPEQTDDTDNAGETPPETV